MVKTTSMLANFKYISGEYIFDYYFKKKKTFFTDSNPNGFVNYHSLYTLRFIWFKLNAQNRFIRISLNSKNNQIIKNTTVITITLYLLLSSLFY